MPSKEARSLIDAFERALGVIRARVCVSAYEKIPLAVAYSGGLDSSVLLHLARAHAEAHSIPIFAFHIHHGLSARAEEWLAHCERECARLGIAFDARRIIVDRSSGSGVEEAARIGRYAALGELCRTRGVPLLLTAHHQNDQAETVLLQLLRGCGLPGLSGMEEANTAPALTGNEQLLIARPLLNAGRAALADFALQKGIAYVEDESNTDIRYARNALRHSAMPTLARSFPGFEQRLIRTARHAQAAQRLLDILAAQDLACCLDGDCLNLDRLRELDTDRIDNLLRYWFGVHGMRMPSTAWLHEMRMQLLDAKTDAQICVTHPDCQIRRHRERAFLLPRPDTDLSNVRPLKFRWNGEASISFASYGGTLYFDQGDEGIDPDLLRQRDLQVHYRSGGERLKLAWNRPSRSLKQHFQTLDIASWERVRLPLVSMERRLLFAAGIGMDCRCLGAGPGIRLRWQPFAD